MHWQTYNTLRAYRSLADKYFTFIVYAVCIYPTHTVSLTLPHQSNYPNSMISATPQTNNIQHQPPSPTTDGQTLANNKPVESYYCNMYPLVALGALQGLSLLLLAVVTTGWVCTCMSMKKREAKINSMTQIRYNKVTFLCARVTNSCKFVKMGLLIFIYVF